jgi:hypothetical protein
VSFFIMVSLIDASWIELKQLNRSEITMYLRVSVYESYRKKEKEATKKIFSIRWSLFLNGDRYRNLLHEVIYGKEKKNSLSSLIFLVNELPKISLKRCMFSISLST